MWPVLPWLYQIVTVTYFPDVGNVIKWTYVFVHVRVHGLFQRMHPSTGEYVIRQSTLLSPFHKWWVDLQNDKTRLMFLGGAGD
jgi:hypothetical protein